MDVVQRRNSFPILNRIDRWLNGPGLVVVVLYAVVMVAAMLILRA